MSISFSSQYAMKALNTFGMDIKAQRFCTLHHLDDLPGLLAAEDFRQEPVLWLGGGSNILFTQDFAGLVIRVGLQGIRVVENKGDELVVEAAAGENWHQFVRHTLQQGWFGLENLSLIPGTVGASPIQNIGAYGVEVKDHISEVVCADLGRQGEMVVLSNADCHFAYRDSVFKHQAAGRLLVTAVRFRLSRTVTLRTGYGDIQQELDASGISHPTPLDVSEAVIRIRSTKLPNPAELGNAGSFFKNPVVGSALARQLKQQYPAMPVYTATEGKAKLAAGWLIDQAGFKGWRDGDAGVHARQALVLVNYGTATGQQIQQLAHAIQAKVKMLFGVELEPEPLML